MGAVLDLAGVVMRWVALELDTAGAEATAAGMTFVGTFDGRIVFELDAAEAAETFRVFMALVLGVEDVVVFVGLLRLMALLVVLEEVVFSVDGVVEPHAARPMLSKVTLTKASHFRLGNPINLLELKEQESRQN